MYATVRYHLLQTFIQTINNKLNMFCIRSEKQFCNGFYQLKMPQCHWHVNYSDRQIHNVLQRILKRM